VRKQGRRLRNPGPAWGYHFLSWADACWPRWLFDSGVKVGVLVALLCMPRQRRYSRQYLAVILERPVTFRDCWLHFYTLTQSLLFKFKVGRSGGSPKIRMHADSEQSSFLDLVRSERPALFGTFHVGHSDMLGCMLAEFDRKVHMVRERVGNAYDLKMLERVFGDSVEFVWINEGESMLFALKNAAEDGASLALQCDREEHGSRHHSFDFLGGRRRFPVTIYHLAFMFSMPVVFSIGLSRADGIEVVCSDIFEPVGDSKQQVLAAGFEHFQGVLTLLETTLKRDPYTWFNFLPLNTDKNAHRR